MKLFAYLSSFILLALSTSAQDTIQWTSTPLASSLLHPSSVGQYKKFECSIPLYDSLYQSISQFITDSNNVQPNFVLHKYQGTNPYNPKDINVEIVFMHESGETVRRYGYFHQQFTYAADTSTWIPTNTGEFFVRFSPHLPGSWQVHIGIDWEKNNKHITYPSIEFFCEANEHANGVVQAEFGNKYFEFSNTNKTFVINGLNICHPEVKPRNSPYFNNYQISDFQDYFTYFTKAAKANCNFIRIALIGAYTSAPEFDMLNNYHARQKYMYEFDKLIEYAESTGLYFQIIGDSFGAYSLNWDLNPYQNIAGITSPFDFFQSDEAMEYYKNRVRYIFSRWGYSTSFCMFEIFNEIDQIIYKETRLPRDIVYTWNSEIADYIRHDLQFNTLITTNFAGFDNPPYIFSHNNIDLVTVHYYGRSRNHDLYYLYSRIQSDWNTYKKPIIIDETGGDHMHSAHDRFSELLYKNRLFSTTFSGGAGGAIQYFWTTYLPKNTPVEHTRVWYNKLLSDYLAIVDTLSPHNFNILDLSPQRYPNFTKQEQFDVKYYDNIHSLVENFALTNYNKNIVLGWAHNRSHYWANVITSNNITLPLNDDITPTPIIIDWQNPNPDIGEFFILENLAPNTAYTIRWYSTNRDNYSLKEITGGVMNFTTNKKGTSKNIFPPFSASDFDLLYIITSSQ